MSEPNPYAPPPEPGRPDPIGPTDPSAPTVGPLSPPVPPPPPAPPTYGPPTYPAPPPPPAPPTYGSPTYPTPPYPATPSSPMPSPGYGATGAPYATGPTTSGRAVAVLVLGISALVGLCFYGLTVVCAIVALALAPGAKREIRESNGWKTGEGMVKAGVICSWIAIALAVIAIVVVVVVVIVAANAPHHASSAFGA